MTTSIQSYQGGVGVNVRNFGAKGDGSTVYGAVVKGNILLFATVGVAHDFVDGCQVGPNSYIDITTPGDV